MRSLRSPADLTFSSRDTGADEARRSPGRPPVRDPDETRRTIIDAAAAEMVATGFAQASMSRIAQRAGVSTRTLYRIADSKERLFRMVVDHRIARLFDGLPGAMATTGSDSEDLKRLVRLYAGFVLNAETHATVRILLEEQGRFPDLIAQFQKASQHVADRFEARIGEILALGGAGFGDAIFTPQLVRLIFLGEQRQQILQLSTVRSEADIERLADRVVRFISA